MNKEALAKKAFQSFMGSAQTNPHQKQYQQHQQHQQQQQIQLQQQQQAAKNRWWNKTQEPHSVLSLEEQKILKRVKSRAHFLDRGISCCCFQVGFDGLVGFVPVIGDFIGLILALQLVHMAMEAQLPNELISKMMFNIGFDFMIGLVPIVGDIMDIMYKCNTKNAILLENHLIKRRNNMLQNNPRMNMAGNPPLLNSTMHHASAPAIAKK